MSRNDISVILVTAGPEFRVSTFCADTYDEELYVCDWCTENNPCQYGRHDLSTVAVSRKAMAECFGGATVFTDEESAVRHAEAPGMDEYDVPEYGHIFERQTDVEFPRELVVSKA